MNKTSMLNILVKLQAKLGDTIIGTSLLKEVKSQYLESQLDVIMGKGLTDILILFEIYGLKFRNDGRIFLSLRLFNIELTLF